VQLGTIKVFYFVVVGFGGVAAHTTELTAKDGILTEYFNNYNFSKLK